MTRKSQQHGFSLTETLMAVGTLAIGNAGARNAALLAVRILAIHDAELRRRVHEFQKQQTAAVMEESHL